MSGGAGRPTLRDVERLRAAGQAARAEEAARAVRAAEPAEPKALRALVGLLLARGELAGAEAECRAALAGGRMDFDAQQTLGVVLTRRGRRTEAIAASRAALALRPDDALALRNLGALLRVGKELQEALALLERAARLAPHDAGVHAHLGAALSAAGEHVRALVHLEKALALAPGDLDTHGALFGALHYASAVGPVRIADAHRRFGTLLEAGVARLPPRALRPEPGRRLRLGYVSADFRLHSVAFFLEPLLAHHDRARFELFAYSQTAALDDVSQRLLAHVDVWRDLVGLTDDAAAERVRADEIDLLIDLSGHTTGNRLGVFARRPAPAQLTYLGYPDTTGLSSIDFRVTDAESDPPGLTEPLHTERLLRVEGGFLCYRPPEGAPPAAPAPSTLGHPPTFASFNALTKLSAETLALWARLLRETPEARLLLKHATLSTPEGRARYAEKLEAHGVPTERVTLRGYVPGLVAHLEAYAEVDVALDPFPYHGTTTTCDALFMGVPVVSLLGGAHVSRVGASLLARAGLRELAVDDADAYVATARALLGDEPRRVALRASLRERLHAGGLTDPPRFARAFEAALLEAARLVAGRAQGAAAGDVASASETRREPLDTARTPDTGAVSERALPDPASVWRVSRGGLRVASPADETHPVARALETRGALAEEVPDFLGAALGAGGVAVEVGADHGLVALSLARAAGPTGRVCAEVADPRVAARLRASASANGFAQLAVREAASGADAAVRVAAGLAGLEVVSVVRLGGDACVPAAIDALASCLASDAPLVVLACDARGALDAAVRTALAVHGWAPYRLVPALGLLWPLDDAEPAEPGRDTLFAASPARAAHLAARGLLADPAGDVPTPPAGLDAAGAVSAALLGRFPALRRALDADTPGHRAHRAALAHVAWASDPQALPRVRALALRSALAHALRALDGPHELARFLTLARAADAWGQRALAIEALTSALAVAGSPQGRLSEPFLAPAPRFDTLDPGARLRDWAVAAILERLEQLRAPSAPASSPDPAALAQLETHARLGFPSPEMARRWRLRRSSTPPAPR